MLPFYLIKGIPPLKNKLYRMYTDRAYQIFPKISPFISSRDRVLDIGCGTGALARTIKKNKHPKMSLVDVQYNSLCDQFPVLIYDGKKLPFKNKEFDTSLMIAVLHHTHDPSEVIDEAIRVTKSKIIIVEDIFSDVIGRAITFIGDCLVNFEIHSPFKNHDKAQWLDIFQKKKLKLKDYQEFKLRCIGFPFKLAVFVLEVN